MSKNTSKAFMLVAATASLFVGGLSAAGNVNAEEASVKCGGVTGCKGSSDCATAENGCKGMNSCKGKGYKVMTKAECEKKGGKIIQ